MSQQECLCNNLWAGVICEIRKVFTGLKWVYMCIIIKVWARICVYELFYWLWDPSIPFVDLTLLSFCSALR